MTMKLETSFADAVRVTLDPEQVTRQRDEEIRRVRETVRQFKFEMLGGKENATVFKEKAREFEELYEDEREYAHRAAVRLANTSQEQRWLNEWVLERALDRREKYKREMGRFQFYLNVCRGKERMRPDRAEEAKQVPIGTILINKAQVQYAKRAKYLCPLHDEKTPSFVWYKDQNTWHCFGACGKGGDVIDLVMKMEGISFVEALKFLTR